MICFVISGESYLLATKNKHTKKASSNKALFKAACIAFCLVVLDVIFSYASSKS